MFQLNILYSNGLILIKLKTRLTILTLLICCVQKSNSSAASRSSTPSIAEILAKHPTCRSLVVGCGKNPGSWKSSSESRGQYNEWEATKDGDHSHTGCLTLAENSAVQPDLLLDWTQPVPESMHDRFDVIYLEKLPPVVLEQPICMQNLFFCLSSKGRGYLDHQFQQKPGTDYTLTNPFTMTVPPFSEETQQKISGLKKLEEAFTTKFYQQAGITKEALMSKEEFEALILSNPIFEKMNKKVFEIKGQIENLIKQERLSQNTKAYVLLREPANSLAKEYMEKFGFQDVSVKVYAKEKNPFNGRLKSVLIQVQKP